MSKESKNTAIELAFENEIGISLSSAIASLCRCGVSIEDLAEITGKTKVILSDEIEKRKIPMECRFLLLNVVLCSLFDISMKYHKRFVEDLNREMIKSEGEIIESEGPYIELVKEK